MTNERLCEQIQAGQKDLLLTLYEQNSGLIAKVIKKFCYLAESEDLEQQAYIALHNAAYSFNCAGDNAFTTFFCKVLENELIKYCHNTAAAIRQPQEVRKATNALKRTETAFLTAVGREPDQWEKSLFMGISCAELGNLEQIAQRDNIVSIETPITEDLTIADIIPDPAEDMTERIYIEQRSAAIWQAVERLKEEQRAVIREYYADDAPSMREVSERLHISKSKANSDHISALRRLRHDPNLKAFLADDEIFTRATRATGAQAFKDSFTSATERVAIELYERGREHDRRTEKSGIASI